MNVAELTQQLVQPIVDRLGLTLWDVEFKKEGSDYILRVTIDRDEGVSITDCENVNRELDPLLDQADPIEQSYILEVTSAGLVRELKKEEHIRKFIGKTVTLRLFKPVDGSKTREGELLSFEGGILTLKVGEETQTFARDTVAKITIDLV